MKFTTALLTAALSIAMIAPASATPTEFIPPNAPLQQFSANTNDGWSQGRGIGFKTTQNQVINSVGLFQNLNNVTLNYGVYEISGMTDGFTRTNTLRSGSGNATTAGAQWIDFAFSDLTLVAGTNYLIEFSFNGNSAQNFFFNNGNNAWSQGVFTGLDGTMGTNFSNFVVADFRVNAEAPRDVPEPGSVFLFGAAMIGLAAARRRRA